jgi:hypothetical protein
MKWQLLPDDDVFVYAQSFRRATTAMMKAVDIEGSPFAAFDACPVMFLYRSAVELALKALVLGEGGNFLATRPDRLSVYKTHSLSWLAQFASQIVSAVGWEAEFTCEGVADLTDFKTVVQELNDSGPAVYGLRVPVGDPESLSSAVREFARRTEALLTMLEETADALAAEWGMRSEGGDDESRHNGGQLPPTVH